MQQPRTPNRPNRTDRTIAAAMLVALLLLISTRNGFSQPIRVDPRHPGVATLQEWGYMVGTLDSCVVGGEEFGRGIVPVGDVSGDGIADFILERYRCDYATSGRRANELLLYHGVKGGLPDASSGQRIGPSELGSETHFLCTGDWDQDHYTDLAVAISMFGDTSGGNTGYTTWRLVVFWGSAVGYGIDDTTRLNSMMGSDLWIGLARGMTSDFSGDGVEDLLVWGGWSLRNGEVITLPTLQQYSGSKGRRWGQKGVDRNSLWQWWTPPPFNYIPSRGIDHDCDGTEDIVMVHNNGHNSSVSILYGKPGELPDTTNVERVSLAAAGGQYTLLQDVTGDGMLDLVTWCGQDQERVKIFAGAKGQRLIEQYGTGTDSADKATGRYPLRPWAEIWMPSRLHDGWFLSDGILFDLGDLNGDGMAEVFATSWPFMIGYTTGRTIDSLIDIVYNAPSGPVYTMTRLGDIDGSGEATIGITHQGRVHFLKAKAEEIPTYGGTFRALPHPEGIVCGASGSASVEREDDGQDDASSLLLRVTPNPGDGSLRLTWDGRGSKETAEIQVHDVAGEEISRMRVPASAGTCRVGTEESGRGIRYVTLIVGPRRATVPVAVR